MTLFWPSCCRRLFRFCHILITRSFSVCGSDGTWELSHYRLSIVYSIIGESLIAPDKVELTDEAAGKQTISVARIPSRHHQPSQPSQSTTTVTDSIVPRRSLTWKSMQHPRRQRQTVPIAIIISCFAVSSLRLVPVSPHIGCPRNTHKSIHDEFATNPSFTLSVVFRGATPRPVSWPPSR